VMEILCAYVRENSNARKPETCLRHVYLQEETKWNDLPEHFDAWFCERHSIDQSDLRNAISTDEMKEWAGRLSPPREDVALALKVIGRRSDEQRQVEAAWPRAPEASIVWPFDIPCPHLPDGQSDALLDVAEIAQFRERLSSWRLRISNYRGYRLDLTGANLQGAMLGARHSDAHDAEFSGAILTDARLGHVDKWRSHSLMQAMSMKPRKLSAVLS
jgi:hypothetical protein